MVEYLCEQGNRDGIALRGPHLDDAPPSAFRVLGADDEVGQKGLRTGTPILLSLQRSRFTFSCIDSTG